MAVFPQGMAAPRAGLGCNCGYFLFWSRSWGRGSAFSDAREHWIRQARFLAAHRTASDGIRFEVCDLYDLPAGPRFNVTFFNGIFYHLPDR